ncbi:MAG: hypothetical protein JXR96_10550 [Deltaproteobacteria bacterium]|nr:hypothetical protein [Deltaproteobacteria bacterium]
MNLATTIAAAASAAQPLPESPGDWTALVAALLIGLLLLLSFFAVLGINRLLTRAAIRFHGRVQIELPGDEPPPETPGTTH